MQLAWPRHPHSAIALEDGSPQPLTWRALAPTYALAAATVDYARGNGARALEAYPMITQPGKEITWGELHVGSRQVFADAGFTEVTHPSPRRVVMRIDFARRAAAPSAKD